MKAVRVTAFGGPEQLEPVTVPDPIAGPGECVLAVEAIDTLLFDAQLRAGLAPEPMAPALPWIPGNGVAGRVLVCGAEVDAALAGRRAAAHTGNRGGYAERVAVPVGDVVAIPDALPTATAAALLHDGPTALRLIAITRVGPGDRVLVVGSSGGLGIALIQLARARGAHVAQRSAAAPASSPGSKHSAPTRRSTPSATAGWRPHASPSAGRQR